MKTETTFKQTQVGKIPNEWKCLRLIDIVKYAKSTIAPNQYRDEQYELYSIPAYYESGKPEVKYGREIHSQKLLIDNGTVLFGKINPRVPKVWLVSSDEKLRKIASTEFIPLIPNSETTVKFLYYLVWSSFLLDKSRSLTLGTTTSRKRVEAEAFLNLPIPVPPLPEQQKIASILSTVDDAIQKTDEIIQKTQLLKKGLMQQLLTKGIGHTKFKKTEIGDIPEEWEVVKLGDASIITMGQSPPGDSYNKEARGLPLLNGPTEFGPKHPLVMQWTEKTTRVCLSGDILMCVRGNTTGRMNIADQEYCIGRGIAAIRSRDGKSVTEFVKYLIKQLSPRILQIAFAAGSTFPNINKEEINAIRVPLPTLSEQQKIASVLSNIGDKIEKDRERKQHLEQLKKGLMQILLSGKVRVKVN